MDSDTAIHAIWNKQATWAVLTGAGISTSSGIGDYRDDHGHWKRRAPIMHQDFTEQVSTRQRYWARSQIGFPEFSRAQPNAAHWSLAELEDAGRVNGVITQNVDGLHQQAGQATVIDLHGRLDQVVCLRCRARTSRADLQTWLEHRNPEVKDDFYTAAPDGDADIAHMDFSTVQVPGCGCGGVLKPDVVFYGDSVPKRTVAACYELIDAAKGLLVVGTSLMVYSSFRFVRYAHQKRFPILAINRGKTRGDDLFTGRLVQDCAAGLEALGS